MNLFFSASVYDNLCGDNENVVFYFLFFLDDIKLVM